MREPAKTRLNFVCFFPDMFWSKANENELRNTQHAEPQHSDIDIMDFFFRLKTVAAAELQLC